MRQTFNERGLKNVVTLMNQTALQCDLVSNFIATSCALFINKNVNILDNYFIIICS